MKILFLCVANSARSQIAEGLAKKIFGTNAYIESAGSEPSGKVHPMAITVMKDAGIDISKHTSKAIGQLNPTFVNELDYVVTLCAEEVCPIINSQAKKLHWPLHDPAAPSSNQKEAFEKTRDIVQEKIKALLV